MIPPFVLLGDLCSIPYEHEGVALGRGFFEVAGKCPISPAL